MVLLHWPVEPESQSVSLFFWNVDSCHTVVVGLSSWADSSVAIRTSSYAPVFRNDPNNELGLLHLLVHNLPTTPLRISYLRVAHDSGSLLVLADNSVQLFVLGGD